ncbi:MAG: adenosylcobalamin-dependent ribonucleoside-diphosphate reductase [Hyphomicrobiaceae bacterium]
MSLGLQVASPVSERIWNEKYRHRAADGTPLDQTIDDTWARVAKAAAKAEPPRQRRHWEARFFEAMQGFGFLPAGRILAGSGTGRRVTLFNCFVMGRVDDDLGAIFDSVKEAALTMQQGGGIGQDFSTLRPQGALVRSIGADASGPVSFMHVWDAMCRTIMSAGARRGAMMATLACDHPDIEAFLAAKSEPGRLTMFNLSVLVTNAFVTAVREDADWDLSFAGKVYRTVRARDLWQKIMQATYAYAEPGVIFIDRVNAANNLAYCEAIRATNPCGEQPLPPYGACLLGSINLASLVRHPFTAKASLDEARLDALVAVAVRFLDDVVDVSGYPLPAQRREARQKRRLGLGLTGLADALIMLGLRYDSAAGTSAAAGWMRRIKQAAYAASVELAAEKGSFPLYDEAAFLGAPGVGALPAGIRRDVARHGIRNGLLTSIAPTGTISLLAGNVSSGIEPVFDFNYERRLLAADGSSHTETVADFAYALYRAQHGGAAGLPDAFVTAGRIAPEAHLDMMAALQPHVDSAISKTINCPEDMEFAAFEKLYIEAFDRGLKGCTTFRPNAVTGAVLTQSAEPAAQASPADGAMPRARQALVEAGPIARQPVLSGFTYKLRWPDSEHALYVTINDIEHDGRRRPFEIFINSKNLEHYAWTVALTRMISAVFRRGGDVSFVVEELKAVFDPRGGHWLGGRYVPSLLAAIGEIVERHMRRTGFLDGEALPMRADAGASAVVDRLEVEVSEPMPGAGPLREPTRHSPAASGHRVRGVCPRCASQDLIHVEGCLVCRTCGFSRCQ